MLLNSKDILQINWLYAPQILSSNAYIEVIRLMTQLERVNWDFFQYDLNVFTPKSTPVLLSSFSICVQRTMCQNFKSYRMTRKIWTYRSMERKTGTVYRCWEDNWTKELLKDSCIYNDRAKISPCTQIKIICTMPCKWRTNKWVTRWLIWQSPSVKQALERKDLAEISLCIVITDLPPSMHNVKVKSVQFENLSSSLTIS